MTFALSDQEAIDDLSKILGYEHAMFSLFPDWQVLNIEIRA